MGDQEERKGISDHRFMAVYADTLELSEIAQRVADRIRRRRCDLAEQLERASASVAMNLGEGANEFSPRDKARFYRFSQRSAGECQVAFDLIIRLRLEEDDSPRGRAVALSIASQMGGLAIAMLARAKNA